MSLFSGVGEDRKQDEAGGGEQTGKAGTDRERGTGSSHRQNKRVDMINFLESRRSRVQSRTAHCQRKSRETKGSDGATCWECRDGGTHSRGRERGKENVSGVYGEQEKVEWPFAEGKLCNQLVLTPDESYFCKAGLLSQCSGFKFLPSPGCPLLVF